MGQRANILGDVRAEADTNMLAVAFYETPDYRLYWNHLIGRLSLVAVGLARAH